MRDRLVEQLKTQEPHQMTTREAVKRGTELVLPSEESLIKEMCDRRIKLYLGIDPTSANLHIGHLVPLRKLRHFQDLGHEVHLLFGTFTGMIGDPSDKKAARIRLTRDQIDKNVATYAQQASRVLDLTSEADNPINIQYNHEWLGALTFEEVVDLASNFTVQQMLKRNMFQNRIEQGQPVYLHEFLYPLMQGYDAVAMDVDLEVGGKDQLYNMMTGRVLVQKYHGHEKWVMGTKLIEDPTGRKMGKTERNIVNINDYPEIAYEAFMSWSDLTIPMGLELLTDVPLETISRIKEQLPTILSGDNSVDIMQLKEGFAHRIVKQIHGEDAADYAREEFDRVKRKKMKPRRIKTISVSANSNLSSFLVTSGLAKDLDEAQSRLAQGAIYVDDHRTRKNLLVVDGMLIKIGKRTIGNIRHALVN